MDLVFGGACFGVAFWCLGRRWVLQCRGGDAVHSWVVIFVAAGCCLVVIFVAAACCLVVIFVAAGCFKNVEVAPPSHLRRW